MRMKKRLGEIYYNFHQQKSNTIPNQEQKEVAEKTIVINGKVSGRLIWI